MKRTPDWKELELKLQATAFRVATPINSMELFAGRQPQTRSILAAANQNGRHVVVFGERGVGKTSLANMLFFLIEVHGWPKLAPVVNCARNDSYGSLWGRVFNEISRLMQKLADNDQPIELPQGSRKLLRVANEAYFDGITMDAVKAVLTDIGERATLLIAIDEFDTLENQTVRQGVADTIKYLSDRNVPCTIVVIGVSDDVDGLIADHRSIERCLAQVNMPRMSRDELEETVMKCLTKVQMEADEVALHEISRIASGLPHYAHLLGLYAALTAVGHKTIRVTSPHVLEALPAAIENSHHTVRTAYVRATESSQQTAKYREVLTACAMALTNELGYFSPSDVREPLSLILKKPARIEAFARHLHTFCGEDGGPILKRIVIKGHPQFRFINPLMQPFAVMKALADSLISEEDLKATRNPRDAQKRLF